MGNRRKNVNTGFTLIEFVMVILLSTVMAIVVVPNFIDARNTAKSAVTEDRLQALKQAIDGDSRVVSGGSYVTPGFRQDMGRYPVSLSELVNQTPAMSTYDPINRTGWRGPYIDTSQFANYSQDAWGTAFVFNTVPSQLQSCGPDKICNNADDIYLSY